MLDVEEAHHERLEALDRDVRHVAARDHDVTDARRPPQVVEHRVPPAFCFCSNLYFRTWTVSLPTRSIRVQCRSTAARGSARPGPCRVAVREALDGPMSASCRESRVANGWDGNSASRSLRAGAM